jgi:hypothetical protein
MKIKLIDPIASNLRLHKLAEGDWFVRWASPRKPESCTVYMKLHDHSRLSNYGSRDETVPCVALKSGYITNMQPAQPVVRIRDNVELELDL